MSVLIWLSLFIATGLTLAYHRAARGHISLSFGVLLVVYTLSAPGWPLGVTLWALYVLLILLLHVGELRREHVTRPLMGAFRRILPVLSDTERTALDAGTVWWEGELFSGAPDWQRLHKMPPPLLSDAEQAFLDGPVLQVVGMCDGWRITHEDADLPPAVWRFLKQKKFFGMIIPKAYGGLEFSAYAHSCVLARLGGGPAGATLSSTVAVPNSLGPAELLLHYGTESQKQYYLPRLANGREIPCFALTNPHAGSDAAAMSDRGVVCRGQWQGEQVLGMRLTWNKRYITLAPVATILGLAFKLYDPQGLLGEPGELGITCALIPTDTEGVQIGRRHLPLNAPFQNGPTQGEDVFVPLDFIIGGREGAGQGWRMLMECLSVGRAISLPSSSAGAAATHAFAAGAYARVRRQFNVHIGAFEGVAEALARIGGRAYACESLRRFTANAVDLGEKPTVPSAIAKYHCTHMAQQIAIDAMDIHAGKGICLGPSNTIGRGYQGAPIAVTVEGANILTRSLIIFGQGAIRCHPYALDEMEAAADPDEERGLIAFDAAFIGHIGHILAVSARSLVLGVTQGWGSGAPGEYGLRRYYQRMNRFAANLALLTEVAMVTLGGSLKFRESISARLGDILSHLYVVSATLQRFMADGAHDADRPLLDWVCEERFAAIEAAADGVCRNLPSRSAAWLARALVFPIGRHARPPADATDRAVAELLQTPDGARERLTVTCPVTGAKDDALTLLDTTMRAVIAARELEKRILAARKDGRIDSDHPAERIEQGLAAGVIDADEAAELRALLALVEQVIRVDDFDSADLRAGRRRRPRARKSAGAKA